MKRRYVYLSVAALVLTASLSSLLFPPLRQALGIAVPSTAEFTASQGVFASALSGGDRADFAADAAALGLLASDPAEGWSGTLLSEAEGQCAGRGIYLVREDHGLGLAIMAPHRGADRHTGTLAAQLFIESNAAAAAWNSAPRRPTAECPNALDLAREEQHPFTAFALAFAQQHPQGWIVQLHGFDRGKRQDPSSQTADMIVSNGTMEPDERLFDLADCLSLALDPRPVRVFPNEAAELGALTNAQGAALRAAGFSGFVHLEISSELRSLLTTDPAMRAQLLQCLATGG